MPRKPKDVSEKETKKKVFVREIIDTEEQDNLEEIATDIETEEKLGQFRDLFTGKQYKIRVEKFNFETHEYELCEKALLDGFDPFNLRKKYGAGKYKCVLLNEQSRYVEGGSMYFSFAAPLETEEKGSKSPFTDPSVMFFIQNLEKNQMLMLEMFKTAMTGKANEKDSLESLMGALGKLKELDPSAKSPSANKSLEELLGLFAKFQDLMGSKDEEKGGLMSDAKEVLALLPQLAGALKPPMRPAPPPMRGARPAIGNNGGNEVTPLQKKLSVYMPRFIEAAQSNEAIDPLANYLISILDTDMVPWFAKQYPLVTEDTAWDWLINAGKSAEQTDKIFAFAPELAPYKSWVTQVIAQAVEILEKSDIDDDGPADPSLVEAAKNGVNDEPLN